MTRLRHFGEATPILRYSNWVAAALVTHTAIHHWIVLDIRRVIERDEAMPYQLRIDPKRYYSPNRAG